MDVEAFDLLTESERAQVEALRATGALPREWRALTDAQLGKMLWDDLGETEQARRKRHFVDHGRV